MNVGQEAPVCACSNRWAERAAGRAGGCGQQLRAERCCRAEHAAGGQKADGRAGAAACRGWSARVRGRVRRARVARLLDLHLLLLRGAVAVVVVVSDCHRNVPSCARNSLSRSLSLSLACAVRSIACSLAFSLLSLSSLHVARVQWLGITLVGIRVLRLLQLTVGLVFAANISIALWISHRHHRRCQKFANATPAMLR